MVVLGEYIGVVDKAKEDALRKFSDISKGYVL